MKNQRLQRFVICLLCAVLCGAVYAADVSYFHALPDFLSGMMLGLGLGLLVVALLPDKVFEKLKEWKNGGK